MIWVVISIVPYGLLVSETGMNVNWATLSAQALTSPFLWPLFLTITWSKATSQGVIAGKPSFVFKQALFL
jgi:Na+/proline symporter